MKHNFVVSETILTLSYHTTIWYIVTFVPMIEKNFEVIQNSGYLTSYKTYHSILYSTDGEEFRGNPNLKQSLTYYKCINSGNISTRDPSTASASVHMILPRQQHQYTWSLSLWISLKLNSFRYIKVGSELTLSEQSLKTYHKRIDSSTSKDV